MSFFDEQPDAPLHGECAQEIERLKAALETIAGGHTSRFPGAPCAMTAASPNAFRSAMWRWSQAVANAAIRSEEGK